MTEREKKSKRTHLRILSFAVLGAAAAFMIYSVVVRKKIDLLYDLVIAIGIMAFWVINDIVIPAKTGEFEGRTKEQMEAFRKYALLSGIGYGGLVFFAVSLQGNNGFYGALVYLIAVMYKRRYYDTYQGNGEETPARERADENGQAAEKTERSVLEMEQKADEATENASRSAEQAPGEASENNASRSAEQAPGEISENASRSADETGAQAAESATEDTVVNSHSSEDEEIPTVEDIYRSIGKKH